MQAPTASQASAPKRIVVPLVLMIALRHLRSRPRQSLIATLGVTFGIAMFIVMISFMTGVNDLIEESLLTNSPHVRLYHDIENDARSLAADRYPEGTDVITHHQRPKQEQLNLKDGFSILAQLRADPRVAVAGPMTSTQVFFTYGATQLTGVLAGVDIAAETRLFGLDSKMREGSPTDLLTSTSGVLIGAGLSRKLNLHRGDRLTVTSAQGVRLTLDIKGVFATGVGAIDDSRAYVTLNTAQRAALRAPSYITDINVKLVNVDLAQPLSDEWETRYGYRAENWREANAAILFSFTIRNVLTAVVSITLLIVAGFGIYNIMSMTIYEKMRDIAILKATGFAGADVVSIFLTQAGLIGLMGGLGGVVIGLFFSFLLSLVPFDTGGFLAVDHLPVNFKLPFYAFGLCFGIVTTLLAAWFPSRRAARIDPVVILRSQ